MSNPHASYIDARIADLKRQNKFQTIVVNTSHDDFIRDFVSSVFTNLIHVTFTKTYVKRADCADCQQTKAEQRCHGIGQERGVLLRRALERVYPDTTVPIKLQTIVVAFLEEHKNTQFALKCEACHKAEGRPSKRQHCDKEINDPVPDIMDLPPVSNNDDDALFPIVNVE